MFYKHPVYSAAKSHRVRAVDNRLAFIQSDHPRESLSVPIACKLYLSRLSESKMSKKTFPFFCFIFFNFCPRGKCFCLCDGTRLPHRSIDISFSIVMRNRTACDKLQITSFDRCEKKHDGRIAYTCCRAVPVRLVLWKRWYIFEARRFCRVNVGSGVKNISWSVSLRSFTSVSRYCYTESKACALYLDLSRIDLVCQISFFFFNGSYLYVCIYLFAVSVSSSIYFIQALHHQNGIRFQLFFLSEHT